MVQELLRALNSTREAQENENKRRIAWEQALEAKYQRRQAETETQLAEMKREIDCLQECVASLLHQQSEGTAQASGSGYLLDEHGSPSLAMLPGSSLEKPPPLVSHGSGVSGQLHKPSMLIDSPSPSPSASPCRSNRKRSTPPLNHRESDSGDSESETSQSSTGKRPQKRINNHDKTCYTIQVS
jgi:hypothetical protein